MKFKVYYTTHLSDVATQIFTNNDVEVKVASGLGEELYLKELKEYQPDVIMCRTEPVTAAMMDVCTNLKGIGKLVEGMDVDDVIARIEGVKCGMKSTSCPDQLAQALKQVLQQEEQEQTGEQAEKTAVQ